MSQRNTFTGQIVANRDHNDNAPARYSAPSTFFKGILAGYANPYCRRCCGTGYIGVFKHVEAGRCFKCIPENVWDQAQERLSQTALFCEDDDVPKIPSGGLWIETNQPHLTIKPPQSLATSRSAYGVFVASASKP